MVLLDLKSPILREVSVCPRGPNAVLFRLAKFRLEALGFDREIVNDIYHRYFVEI